MEVTYINFGPPWLSGSCHPRSTHHLLGSEITGHGGVGGLRHVQREPISGAEPEPAGLDDTGDADHDDTGDDDDGAGDGAGDDDVEEQEALAPWERQELELEMADDELAGLYAGSQA
jgi:hypothetical protein